MSTFSGLSTALTALYAQRRGLDVTGQNIANANTDGYSRQRAELSPVASTRVPAVYSTGDPGFNGVTVNSVTRLHDEFLDNRARAERGLNAYLGGQKDVYSRIEQVIGEPSSTGLQSQLSELWASWHDVANRPADAAARTQLLSRASTVAGSLGFAHDGLASLWGSTREQLTASVADVNQTAIAVADLNGRIVLATQAGLPANELSDQRDKMVMRLSDATGATARARMDGGVDVLVSGSALVSGQDVRKLEIVGAIGMDGQATDPPTVRWADTLNNAAITGGSVASTLESLNTTLPDAAAGLDVVAASLAQAVNDQHHLGFDPSGAAGGDFFTGTTATTIAVAITDPQAVAASGDATSAYDGSNATALANLAKDPVGTDATYRTYVASLGVSAQTINRRADIQNVITQDVDAARIASSGVSLDEEMTNMLQFQRAYEAAAKVMSVVDATLDTLINGIKR
jgi:flagellar hook-associated protein 1 FlgK